MYGSDKIVMIVRKFRILGDTAEGSAEHTMIHEPIIVYSNNIIPGAHFFSAKDRVLKCFCMLKYIQDHV